MIDTKEPKSFIDEIKERMSQNDFLVTGDVVYVSYYIDFDFRSVKYKIDEYLHNRDLKVKFTVDIKEANTILIDFKDINSFSLNAWSVSADADKINNFFLQEFGENNPYSEAMYALDNNFKIINKDNLFNLIHSDLTIIDKEMFDNLNEMLNNNYAENYNLAIEIIANSNRTDDESYFYLAELYDTHSFRLLSTNNLSAFEFVTSISNDPRYDTFIKNKTKGSSPEIVFSKTYTVEMWNKIKDIVKV